MYRLNVVSLGLVFASVCVATPAALGQIRGVQKGSAEEAARTQQYLNSLPKKAIPLEPLVVGDTELLPQLSAKSLKEGGKYLTSCGLGALDLGFSNTWAQVVQVIDENSMLVGIDNGADGSGVLRYEVLVMCKFPTKGITDGKKDFLGEILGTKEVTISGTTKYKSTDGGTRTVFVMEPYTRPKKAYAPGGKPPAYSQNLTGKWIGSGVSSKGEMCEVGVMEVKEGKDGSVTGTWGAPVHLSIEKGKRVSDTVLEWEGSDAKGYYQARCTQKGQALVIDWTYTPKEDGKFKGDMGTIILVRK